MHTSRFRAPDYEGLRPLRGDKGPFPIIDGLANKLANPPPQPDATIARVLATCAGYSYSDLSTVATMMTRLGLPRNRCVQVSEIVDAMFICSNAFLVQSEDNQVIILSYRGTEPTNLTNWLTDLTIEPTQIEIPARGRLTQPDRGERLYVHGGFYRNVRATRYEVSRYLKRALDEHPIDAVDRDETEANGAKPLKAFYITGHSLGAAMAVLMAVLIHIDPDYALLRPLLKGVYTFGQPMVGNRALATYCEEAGIANRVHRYVYRRDVVPHVPPRQTFHFCHFGAERRYGRDWEARPNTTQMDAVGLAEIPLEFLARQLPGLSKLPFRYSLVDHGPEYYIQALTPNGAPTEFGDDSLGVVTL